MRAGLAVVVCSLLGLAGCSGGAFGGANQKQASQGSAGAKLTGLVRGGQQPISGAHVYLLAANTTGYGGAGITASASNASVSLLAGTGNTDALGGYVTTDATGNFSITGDYTCTPGQQVYLYALGGDPGAGTNSAVGLLAALGSCPAAGNFLNATPYIVMNEVSTVAAAYAFAGFATDATHVSSSGTALAQTGIANAFANAANLATLATGAALATTPAGNGTGPQSEINTLANVLAACVNTNGAVTGPTTPTTCYTLFTNALSGGTTGIQPTDTATAAINIAHNPGASVATLYGLASGTPPFGPGLGAAPNDWTIAIKFTGGGMGSPGDVAIDGAGNVWITNSPPTNTSTFNIAELASNGAPISPSTGYPGAGLQNPMKLAVDTTGNVWVMNANSGISEFSSSGGYIAVPTSSTIWSQTAGIAIDGANNVWVSNSSNSYGYLLKFTGGVLVSPVSGYAGGGMRYTGPIAIDGSSNVWTASSQLNYSVSELSNSGVAISSTTGYTGGGLNSSGGLLQGIAMDQAGDAWIVSGGGYQSGFLAKLSSTGVPISPSSGYTGGGMFNAGSFYDSGGLAIDGSGNVWIANYGSNPTLAEFSNSGIAITPATGYMAGFVVYPYRIAIDGAGSIWVPSRLTSNVIQFVGAATPVVTPFAVGVRDNSQGMRP